MTASFPSQPHPSLREISPYDSPPPAEWMPLDEIAAAWATFGVHTRHPWGWQATSSAFAALAQEAAACQQVPDERKPAAPVRVQATAAADAYEATCDAIEEGLRWWQSALLWLEQLARQQPCALSRREVDEDAPITLAALLSISRWHQARLRALLARLSLQGVGAMHAAPPATSRQQHHRREVPS